MHAQTSKAKTQATSAEAPRLTQLREAPKPGRPRIPAIIVSVVIAVIAGLSIWYLVRPVPLLVQGEVDATRLDIAARVDGRVSRTKPRGAHVRFTPESGHSLVAL